MTFAVQLRLFRLTVKLNDFSFRFEVASFNYFYFVIFCGLFQQNQFYAKLCALPGTKQRNKKMFCYILKVLIQDVWGVLSVFSFVRLGKFH